MRPPMPAATREASRGATFSSWRTRVAKPLPAEESFRCLVFRAQGFARVRLVGELDFAAAPGLKAELDALRETRCRRVVLDLRSLRFMDSAGLHCILELDAQAREDGRTVALIPGPAAVQRVFEVTHTEALLPFVETERAPLAVGPPRRSETGAPRVAG